MRYRLRTLLIALTLIGCGLGWISWLRQSAAFHRRESARFINTLAPLEAARPEYVEEKVLALAQGRSVTKWVRAANGSGEQSTLLKNGGHMTFSDAATTDVDDWGQAVYHAMMADRFQHALYRPWILLVEKKPTAASVYVPLSDDETWRGVARPPMVEVKLQDAH